MHLAIVFAIVVHQQFNIKVKFTKEPMHIVDLPIVAHLELISKKISLKLWHRAHYFQRVLAHSALVGLVDSGTIQQHVMHKNITIILKVTETTHLRIIRNFVDNHHKLVLIYPTDTTTVCIYFAPFVKRVWHDCVFSSLKHSTRML